MFTPSSKDNITTAITCTVQLMCYHLILNQFESSVTSIELFLSGNKNKQAEESEIRSEHIDVWNRKNKAAKDAPTCV